MAKKKAYSRQWQHRACIIRQRGGRFQVEVNHGGQRKRCSWSTLAEAKTYAEQESVRIKNEGTAAFTLTLDQRRDAAKAYAGLPKGVDLEGAIIDYTEAVTRLGTAPLKEAVDFYLRHHKPVGGTRTISELMTDYLALKGEENCRKRSLMDMKCRIGRLAEDLGGRPVHTITTADIKAWLDENKYTGQTRINYLRVFTSFFNFAKAKHLIDFNPASKDAIKRPRLDEKLPAVFMVKDVERLLSAASEKAPVIVPYLAIGFFAGLRTTELEGINWKDIDFAAKLITVRPEVAKKRRQRHVTLSGNLTAWLAPFAKESGKVSPLSSEFRKGLAVVLKDLELEWIHNGMRHTFASCHLAKHQDISKTALELGHTGNPTMLFNHYRNLVKPADADAYWNIAPKRSGNVVQVPEGLFQKPAVQKASAGSS